MSSTNSPVNTARQYRLLIAGSRHATEVMLQAARKAVERAKANGWAIHVGDAEGVDAAVVAACNELGVNYVCFGLGPKPRNPRDDKSCPIGPRRKHWVVVRNDEAAQNKKP